MLLNIAHACVTTEVNGPGRRFTVWVQGCSLSCPGCFNPDLRVTAPRRRIPPEGLAREMAALEDLDGVSLTGGEPFSQAAGLVAFLDAADRELGRERGSVIAFSGHRLEELRRGPASWHELLERVDLLVDGPYERELAADLPLRGSSNQALVALTPVGEQLRGRVEQDNRPGCQILITAEGEILVTGFPTRAMVEGLVGRT